VSAAIVDVDAAAVAGDDVAFQVVRDAVTVRADDVVVAIKDDARAAAAQGDAAVRVGADEIPGDGIAIGLRPDFFLGAGGDNVAFKGVVHSVAVRTDDVVMRRPAVQVVGDPDAIVVGQRGGAIGADADVIADDPVAVGVVQPDGGAAACVEAVDDKAAHGTAAAENAEAAVAAAVQILTVDLYEGRASIIRAALTPAVQHHRIGDVRQVAGEGDSLLRAHRADGELDRVGATARGTVPATAVSVVVGVGDRFPQRAEAVARIVAVLGAIDGDGGGRRRRALLRDPLCV
jgi:hypothetical protein